MNLNCILKDIIIYCSIICYFINAKKKSHFKLSAELTASVKQDRSDALPSLDWDTDKTQCPI